MNLKHCSSNKIKKMLIVVRAKAFFPDHARTQTPQSCTTLPLWFPFALNVHSRDGPLSIYTFHQYSDNRSWDQSKPAMESQETCFSGHFTSSKPKAWIASDFYFMPWFVCLDVKDFECIKCKQRFHDFFVGGQLNEISKLHPKQFPDKIVFLITAAALFTLSLMLQR